MDFTEPAEPDTATRPRITTFDRLDGHELYGILQLRSQVFVVEQECLFLDQDGVDTLPETLHVFFPGAPAAMADSHGDEVGCNLAPAAYARVLPPDFPDGPASRPGARSIGRVATRPDARGQGWARRLMTEIIDSCGAGPLTLNAQSHLEGFYGSFGFTPNGPRFMEDGIEHTPMSRPAS